VPTAYLRTASGKGKGKSKDKGGLEPRELPTTNIVTLCGRGKMIWQTHPRLIQNRSISRLSRIILNHTLATKNRVATVSTKLSNSQVTVHKVTVMRIVAP